MILEGKEGKEADEDMVWLRSVMNVNSKREGHVVIPSESMKGYQVRLSWCGKSSNQAAVIKCGVKTAKLISSTPTCE